MANPSATGRDEKSRQSHPLEQSYGTTLTIAILALVPFIVVTTAYELFRKQVGAELRIGPTGLELISAISTAGYAFGALLGGDLIQRFPQRQLFFTCEALFVAGCATTATASGLTGFGAGMVLLGFTTGLLLVIALPPVVRRFPPERMPITAAAVNLGFFGATTAGPLIGGAVAYAHVWRWFYAGLAVVSAMVLLTAYFTLPEQEPPQPDIRFDFPAVVLAFFASVLPFIGSGELTGHSFGSYWFMVPLAVGLACLVAMLVTEYHKEHPLSPVKLMWHTIPLAGTIAAMIGGGAFISFLMLAERFETSVLKRTPLATGLSFWPQVVGIIVAAGLLGILVRSRALPLLVLAGMVALIAGGALLLLLEPKSSNAILLTAVGALGFGAGATVSPGLWMAAFSLPSAMVGRTFALVELVRSEADFLLAPVILEVAQVSSGGHELTLAGIHDAAWVAVLVTVATTVFMAVIYLAGNTGLPRPDLDAWLKENRPGLKSPALFAAFRKQE